ncbi:MAG TPA: alpha/beta fold hydrolase [Arenicellales bacterium]|nr:alpha/beta fold hydrolase [Arenicellales bacterium]
MPELYFQDFPGPDDEAPMVVLHGLFGSSVNWRGVAKKLSERRRVLAMDMRNHGRSFNDNEMTYSAMAADVVDTLEAEGIDRVSLLGHSMGGKTAMVVALQDQVEVSRLVVVDIAPVIYTHSHLPLVEALMKLDLAAIESRSDADRRLQGAIEDRMVRQFLLQSLEKGPDGYRWRLNLEALKHGMDDLVGFPDLNGRTFDGPALFLYGAESDYVQPEQRPRIERYFPNAAYVAVDNAGHWLHADRPDALIREVETFFGN